MPILAVAPHWGAWIEIFREQIGPIISAYAPQLGKRDLQRLTKEVLRT